MSAMVIHASMTTEEAALKDDTLELMAQYLEHGGERFAKAALKVHRKTVFEILIQLLRYCPVLTGRLRGSWTPFLDRWGKQSSYARFLNDKSLVESAPKTVLGTVKAKIDKLLSLDAVSQGKAQGFFADQGMITTIGTNVVYAAKVNAQSRYFTRAAISANFIINANFEQFLEAARKAGWVPDNYSDEPRPEAG